MNPLKKLNKKRLKAKISKRLKRFRRPTFALQEQTTWCIANHAGTTLQLTAKEEQSFSAPLFFGKPLIPPYPPTYSRTAPSVDSCWIPNAKVVGGTNYLLAGRNALHPAIYYPDRDVSPLELWGQGKVNVANRTIKIPLGIPKSGVLEAINLCDQTTGNYAHWLTETLPKLALIDEIEEYRHLPLLVDGWIHGNHLESLQTINRHKRTIIGLEMFQHISVDRVLSITPTAYCPHEYRDYHAAMRDGFHFYFSKTALNLLRDRLREAYSKYIRPISRKVYIQRNMTATINGRHVTNIDKLEDIIFDHGIETINIACMTVAQQAKIFMNSDFIIAPTGAALANMIFAKPGCRILVMAATYQGCNYDYFSEMAQLLGHELAFVVGPQVSAPGTNVMHRNYDIAPEHLTAGLKRMASNSSNVFSLSRRDHLPQESSRKFS